MTGTIEPKKVLKVKFRTFGINDNYCLSDTFDNLLK